MLGDNYDKAERKDLEEFDKVATHIANIAIEYKIIFGGGSNDKDIEPQR